MKYSFKDKVVLITGGASGIGRIMGRKALERGAAQLVIWDVSQQNFDETLVDMNFYHDKVLAVQADVSSLESMERAKSETMVKVGLPDVIINNAGIVVGKYFHEHSASDISRTMRINADAPMLLTQMFLNEMMQRNSGAICNIASSAGLISNPKMSVYAASKWSVVGWSDSLRLEMEALKKDIAVTTIMPFYIKTGMFDGVKSRLIPLLEPEDAAERIVKAIERGKKLYAMPMPYWFIRLAQGMFPLRMYDWMMREVFGIYDTMKEFKGRG
jgi:all-trans-retinol dehydrogenase (NAD+)